MAKVRISKIRNARENNTELKKLEGKEVDIVQYKVSYEGNEYDIYPDELQPYPEIKQVPSKPGWLGRKKLY
jgi:hypothetical protein